MYAVYVDGKGKVEWLTKSSYDPGLGTVVFETGHFSIYGIGYKNPARPLWTFRTTGRRITSSSQPAGVCSPVRETTNSALTLA